MSNYIKKAAAHARLMKLASAARLIRRQRALQKYAQAVQMQKAALSAGADAAIGAGLGGLLGGGIGYGLGKKDKKLLAALIGAGAGAGIGGLGGYGLGALLNRNKVIDETGTAGDDFSEKNHVRVDSDGTIHNGPIKPFSYVTYEDESKFVPKNRPVSLPIFNPYAGGPIDQSRTAPIDPSSDIAGWALENQIAPEVIARYPEQVRDLYDAAHVGGSAK